MAKKVKLYQSRNMKFDNQEKIGFEIHNFAKKIWSYNRSITGEENRKTLKQLQKICKKLKIKSFKSRKKVLDWIVPNEWNVKDAWIKDSKGKKIIDFKKNNIHLIGYSTPVKKELSLKELKKNIFVDKDRPTAIPYITSYYQKRWGFCMSLKQFQKLKKQKYKILINSSLKPGALNYGEVLIKGKSKKEIFLSTYICHPSLANDNLSGIVTTIYLAKWIENMKKRKYSYRIIFIPETIGSIAYLSKNLKKLKKNVFCGFNISCVGDNRTYTYLPSRSGSTLSDEVALHVLKYLDKKFTKLTWFNRGSDERQYCSPGVDLPIASIMRTAFARYPEYHTSDDNLKNVVTPKGLAGGFNALKKSIEAIENNCYPKARVLGMPQLGRRGLYTTLGTKKQNHNTRLMMNILTYSDGKNSLIKIAEKSNRPIWDTYKIIKILEKEKLISI